MIYLDHAATSPLRREALEAMWPHLTADFGNPSSTHELGRRAKNALDEARRSVAGAFGATVGEVVFNSGGTEGANTAITGMAFASPRGRRIVTTPVEHRAVLDTCAVLCELYGFETVFADVDCDGRVDVGHLRELVTTETTLCSVIYSNNEIGTVNPIPEIARHCREVGVPLHSDAVQAPGHMSIDTAELGVDAMNIAAHKFGGPRGVGALFVRAGLALQPLINGGGQEYGLRSGTENVAGIVGMTAALRTAGSERGDRSLRDHLINGVLTSVEGARLTGSITSRSPAHASFTFDGVFGESLLIDLENEGIVCSSGSACGSASETSHVLDAIGVPRDVARTAVRFSIGYTNTMADVEAVVATLPRVVGRLRDR